MNKADYQLYLQTEGWERTRWWKLTSVNWTCERCGFMAWTDLARKYLQVHHLSYERLGHERLDDLEALCMHCHQYEHGLRAEPGRGTDPDFIPRDLIAEQPLNYEERVDQLCKEYANSLEAIICRAECTGCSRRVSRDEILIDATDQWDIGLFIYNVEPGSVLGVCPFCGWTVTNCFCGDCKLDWVLRGGDTEHWEESETW